MKREALGALAVFFLHIAAGSRFPRKNGEPDDRADEHVELRHKRDYDVDDTPVTERRPFLNVVYPMQVQPATASCPSAFQPTVEQRLATFFHSRLGQPKRPIRDSVRYVTSNTIAAWLASVYRAVPGVIDAGLLELANDYLCRSRTYLPIVGAMQEAVQNQNYMGIVALLVMATDHPAAAQEAIGIGLKIAANNFTMDIYYSLLDAVGWCVKYVEDAVVSTVLDLLTTNNIRSLDEVLTSLSYNDYLYLRALRNVYVIGTSAGNQVAASMVQGRFVGRNDWNSFLNECNKVSQARAHAMRCLETYSAGHWTDHTAIQRTRQYFPEIAENDAYRPVALHSLGPDTGLLIRSSMIEYVDRVSQARNLNLNKLKIRLAPHESNQDLLNSWFYTISETDDIFAVYVLAHILKNPFDQKATFDYLLSVAGGDSLMPQTLLAAVSYSSEYVDASLVSMFGWRAAATGDVRGVAFVIDVLGNSALAYAEEAMRVAIRYGSTRVIEFLVMRLGTTLSPAINGRLR